MTPTTPKAMSLLKALTLRLIIAILALAPLHRATASDAPAHGITTGDWLTCGPFKAPFNTAWDDQHQPITDKALAQLPEPCMPLGDQYWQRAAQSETANPDILGFHQCFGYTENCYAFGYRPITTNRATTVMLEIDHDDAAQLWLNGKSLGKWGIGHRTVIANLNKGTNHILAKVDQGGGGWDLTINVLPPVHIVPAAFTPNDDDINDTVTAEFAIGEPTTLTVQILNSKGQIIAQPATKQSFTPNNNAITWNGRDNKGQLAPAGTYTIKAIPLKGRILTGTLECLRTPPLAMPPFTEVKNTFPLGVFYDGNQVESREQIEAELKDLRAHHMDTIIFTNNWITRDSHQTPEGTNYILDAMDKLDMRCVIGIEHPHTLFEAGSPFSEPAIAERYRPLVERANNHHSVLAYYLSDEPGNDKAEKLGIATHVLASIDPKRPGLVCLIGTDRIKNVYNAMQTPIMILDPYPIAKNDPPGEFNMNSFGYSDMDMADYIDYSRNIAGPDTRLWTILQTHNFQTQLREPSPAEVRAMSWIALAHGSTGLVYFVYHSQQGWRGLVHEDKETERYRTAADICKQVKPLIPTLLSLKPAADNIAQVKTPNAEAQTFIQTGSDKRFLICVNRNVLKTQQIILQLKQPVQTVTDKKRPDQSPEHQGNLIKVTLAPGDGTLLELD